MQFSLFGFLKWLVGTVLLFVSFAGWALALVNTSILHEDCGDSESCDNFLRRYWWSLMFQVGVMIAAGLLWVTGTSNSARVAIMGFFTLVTVQHIELTGKLLTALDDKSDWPAVDEGNNPTGWIEQEVLKGAASGFAIMVFANMAYMIAFGIEETGMTKTTVPGDPPKTETEMQPGSHV